MSPRAWAVTPGYLQPMTWPDRITVYSKLTVNPYDHDNNAFSGADSDSNSMNSDLQIGSMRSNEPLTSLGPASSSSSSASSSSPSPSAPAPAPSSLSSFTSDILILSEKRQRAAARISEENTVYDYTQAAKVQALPPFMLGVFRKIWDLQGEARVTWRRKAEAIEREVRLLELEVWDREDAVEEMGSADIGIGCSSSSSS
ncbi:hypothetical protein AAP_04517 [Ascosphaera apis ARSEF 7405]|uniref:Uncharacterized protein n=1 Tax=Ascosphaera apis ARSEF 7405 TaxID=392613 RepID=A0A167WM60_9EURO|nr:hypothetical protein AAP_04517 [Ascosphaera apis ARSEF 7405]